MPPNLPLAGRVEAKNGRKKIDQIQLGLRNFNRLHHLKKLMKLSKTMIATTYFTTYMLNAHFR